MQINIHLQVWINISLSSIHVSIYIFLCMNVCMHLYAFLDYSVVWSTHRELQGYNAIHFITCRDQRIYKNIYKDNTNPKRFQRHWEICYSCEGSRSARREQSVPLVGTDRPKRCQKIDLHVKVGDNFDQTRPLSTHFSFKSSLIRKKCVGGWK